MELYATDRDAFEQIEQVLRDTMQELADLRASSFDPQMVIARTVGSSATASARHRATRWAAATKEKQ